LSVGWIPTIRIGPLVEVPVLLGLSYVALFLKFRLDWSLRSSVALV
jgi:ACR3 family arsenite efflux pump ArsB